jgi:hypothetical protein
MLHTHVHDVHTTYTYARRPSHTHARVHTSIHAHPTHIHTNTHMHNACIQMHARKHITYVESMSITHA